MAARWGSGWGGRDGRVGMRVARFDHAARTPGEARSPVGEGEAARLRNGGIAKGGRAGEVAMHRGAADVEMPGDGRGRHVGA